MAGTLFRLFEIEGADVQVGIHPVIARYLDDCQWECAQQAASEADGVIASEGYQPNGLKVAAGESWSQRFSESGMEKEE